jgi:hypothetical protein
MPPAPKLPSSKQVTQLTLIAGVACIFSYVLSAIIRPSASDLDGSEQNLF